MRLPAVDPWNFFDFVVVVASIIEGAMASQGDSNLQVCHGWESRFCWFVMVLRVGWQACVYLGMYCACFVDL